MMAGWIIIFALTLITFVALVWLGKLPRQSYVLLGAVMMLAISGYAMQGRPSLPSTQAQPSTANKSAADALIKIRTEMDLTYSAAKPYLVTSDSWARDGDYGLAASYIKSGIKKNPKDGNLWSALGLQLMLASDGQMSPPAKFAFDQARIFSPNQPAPDYFTGLDALLNGRTDEALSLWQGLLARSSPKAKWRPLLESQVTRVLSIKQKQLESEVTPKKNTK